jgi:spermidine synthase
MRLLPALLGVALAAAPAPAAEPASLADPALDYTERVETPYQTIVLERHRALVSLRTLSPEFGNLTHSRVSLQDPLLPLLSYVHSLYGALFFQPQPRRVLMVGLGGAAFHRLFHAAYPEALLQSVELDPKVLELCRERMAFTPTAQTPVEVMDGRVFIRRDRGQWDWLILDAYRGESAPPHLKTAEFYRECAARLADRGVLVVNLLALSELYYADLRTLREVFPQVVLFGAEDTASVIACAVKYARPSITDPAHWPSAESLAQPVFQNRLDLAAVRKQVLPLPANKVARAPVLTDDHAPVEYLHSRKLPFGERPGLQ